VSNYFSETFRISIKVEVAKYETAVAWLYDLLYGAQFNKERLQVTLAKIQQSLPEMKRDGNTVLGSVWSELVYNESSTSRSGGIITQMDFIPKLVQELQDSPDTVISDFEEIRRRSESSESGERYPLTDA
jgi:Zn-dependent M16 (insulinase) family peptidase